VRIDLGGPKGGEKKTPLIRVYFLLAWGTGKSLGKKKLGSFTSFLGRRLGKTGMVSWREKLRGKKKKRKGRIGSSRGRVTTPDGT